MALSHYPTATVEALFLTHNANNFYTSPLGTFHLSEDPNGIVSDRRHRADPTKSDHHASNLRTVSFVYAEDMDAIADGLSLDHFRIRPGRDQHQASGEGLANSSEWDLATAAKKRRFVAQCLGANILLTDFQGAQDISDFSELTNELEFGPCDPATGEPLPNRGVVGITQPLRPCIKSAVKLGGRYGGVPDSFARDFLRVAQGRRGFVGRVVQAGSIIGGQTVSFREAQIRD